METTNGNKISEPRTLFEKDYVLVLESNSTDNAKPDPFSVSCLLSQVNQMHFEGNKAFLRNPDENINNNKSGGTLGFVDTSMLVLPTKVDDELYKPSEAKDLKKGDVVKVRIGKKDGQAYIVDGVLSHLIPDLQYIVTVRNGNGLEGRFIVDPDNICKSL